MMRQLYRFLIALHPPEFRERYGDEMILIFEDATASWGASSLIFDATRSLARQWFLRPAILKWVGASIGAMVPLIVSFGSFIPWGNVWAAVRALL
jgi:hypothetical protein